MNAHKPYPSKAKQVQQRLLDRDWTLADLAEAAALHAYLQEDEACRQAVADYDALRAALRPEAPHEPGEYEHERAGEDELGDPCDIDTEPAGGWSAFEQRLTARPPQQPTARRRWQPWALQLAAAVTLAALAGRVGYMVGHEPRGHEPASAVRATGTESPAVVSAAPGHYLPDAVEQQVGVFSEVSEVFDRRAGWVAFADGESELGLARTELAEAKRLLLLRLSLARGREVISRADVVIVPGQRATLELPLADGRSLRYLLHVGEQRPARLGLLAEIEAPDGSGETLAALATNLDVQPGQVVAAGSMATATGGYELTLGFREVERAPASDEGGMPW